MAITYDAAKGGYTDGATTWSPNSNGVYEIGNLDQLKFFRDAVNDGNSFNGQTVKLTDSIDLNKEEWTPIGKNGAPFQGTFDGQEKTVSNLKITRGTSNVAANCGIGFFGYTNSPATITNLTINNVDITGSLYVGAIVGYGYTGKEISNCHVTGQIEIEGWWYIGGIGGNGYVSKVSDCSVVGNEGSYIKALNDGSYVGGIWGYRGEGNNTIADCSVDNIDISGMDRIGGICGIAHYVNTIEECSISNSSITADNNIGNVGLIAGANLGNATNGPAILLNNTVDVTTKENFTLEGQVIENPPVLGANINTGAPAQAAIIGDVTRNEAGEIVDGTISVVGTEKDSIDVSSKLDLADGLAFYPNSDGTIGVDTAGDVAMIGETRYESLAEAVAVVKPGETITILTDITEETVSMNGFGIASWNNSTLTATGNITATAGKNVLSGNVESAQLKLAGSKEENRTLTITESANVDLYIKGRLDDGLLDVGKGLSGDKVVIIGDTGPRNYYAHVLVAGDVSVEKFGEDGNASSGAIYIRPYSELVVTGKLDVVGEVHNRGSLVVDGGTMKMSKWLTPKLLGYDTGDSMTVTNGGRMEIYDAGAVTFGEASASLQHMDVVAQYADGMFATISAGGQFVADTLAFANDEDVTLTVTGEGSLFKLYTGGRTELSYYTYVQNEGKIIIADNAVFDVSGLANDNFVNTGTIDISSATATFAVLTNYGTLNVNGGTVTADTNGSNGLIVGDAWDRASGILNVTNGGTLTASYSIQLNSTSVVKIDGGSMSALQMYQSEGGELSIVNGGSVTLTNSYFAMGGRITVGDADSGKTSSLTTVAGDEKRPASLGGDYTGHEGETVLNIEKNGEVVLGTGLLVGHRASIQDNVSKDATVNVNAGGKLQVAASLQIGSVGDDEAVGVVNVNGGTLDASAAAVGLNSKSSLNINSGSFTAQSITNNGAINVTGEALVAAEVAATETGSFTITDATLGEGSRIQFGAMNVDELLPAVTLKGTVTVTDGAYLNTGREGNLTMGFGTGDSGTLNITDGAQVSLGGALYFGSEEALADDGMFYLNISGEGSRLQSDGYNGEFYITGDAVVTVSNGGTIANNARVRSGATYIFGSVDDTVAANVSFRSMELVEQANVTIQGGAVADLGILVFGDQYMEYNGSFTLAADGQLKLNSYSASSGKAEIAVSGMDDDTFSGVWKLIDNTGSNTLDYSAMISNWDEISGSVAVVENDLYRVNVDMTTLKVNAAWSTLDIGEQVADGFYYGFNAFGDMNTAVSSIDRSYVLGDTFKEPITIEMTDATSDTLNLYGMNLVLTGNLTSSGSWNTALVASSSSDPNYITYLKLDNARIELTGTAALEGVNWGKAAVSFDKKGNIVASADQTIQRGTIVELVNGTVFDADNQVNGRGVFFKIDGTSQIYQYGSGNALITMTSGAIVDGGQSTAGDYTSVNQIDARWIYFGKGSGEWEGIYGDKTYFTFRKGANVEAKDRIEFGTGSRLKEMAVEIKASKIVATNNMIIGTEDNAGKITSFEVSDNSLLQAGTDLSIVGTTVKLSNSTLNAATVKLTDGKLNVSGTSAITAKVSGDLDIVNGAAVTFGADSTSDDLRIASGAKVTLRGSLSSGNIYGVDETGTHKYNDRSNGITVNVATGDGETFKSYAWYASNGSTYNVMAGSNVELTYANINATGTVNVAKGATLTTVRESSNIVGTLNVDGTMNGVMTVYAGYTDGEYADGAQAGEVNINGTGTVNTSIMTIGTAVRDDDQYNAAAVEGSNTTASVVVDGGTLNATGFEGELTSKLFVGSDDFEGVLTGKNGAKINVGERSENGTGYMRFVIGKRGTLSLAGSTLTVYNLGGTNNSVNGIFENSGTISMDLASQIITETVLNNNYGTITVDMSDATEFGVYKLIDYTGSGSITDYGSIQLSNNNYSTRIIDNDLYLVRADGAKELYVNSAWQSAAAYKEVTFVDGTTAYYGLNAFDTVDNAVKSLSANDPILLNVTGGVEAITVVGTSVTEVNASAKTADITEDSVIDTDAIVVNLVDINNTNAGWQVYYPLASGSNAQVYGNITTNFLSTTFTAWGEKTADPNFIGGAYAGSTATVYGNTTVNLGAADAADDALMLDTSFLIGAGAGTVNGNSSVNINSGTIQANAIVGGGAWRGQVKGDSSVTISGGQITVNSTEDSPGRAIIGGSYGNVSYDPDAPGDPAATAGKSSVTITGDAVVSGKVVGGSDISAVTNSSVTISGQAQVTGNVYGGGNRGGQVKENAAVTIADSAVLTGNVYGGGFGTDTTDSIVQGSTSVTLSGGTVTGNVYAGGSNSSVAGNAVVTLTGGTVGGDVYGSGEGSGTVAGASTLNVGAADAARYTTTLNSVCDFDVANITNAAVTVEGVFSATQISIADSTLTLNSGFDAATTTVSIEVGAYNAENAALVLGSAVGTAPAISISAGSNALTEARYLVATGFDDLAAFSLEESLAEDYLLRAVDGNIYLYNADAPYFTTELSVTQAEGASVDGNYTFTANFEAEGLLLTGYTLKLYDSATATTPIDEITLGADVVGQEFTFANTVQNFWISVTANGENGLSTDSPTSGRLEVVVTDYDSPVIQSVSSNVASDAITLTSEATDNFGVTGYEFILDGQSLGVQTGSEIALDLSTLTAGTHSYTVNVYDAAGNLATSAEQSFDFTPEPGPGPEPGPTEPANFLYSSQVRMDNGETVSVYATYSDAAAALEYRIGDSGEWLTYDATTGVNVSSSTTVYFREQGITDPVETEVDVTVVPADVELNAEVILLARTTDTTYEVIYNFADGGSKAVELSGNSVEHYALPENTTVTIVEKDPEGSVVNTIVEETPVSATTSTVPDKVVAVDDGHDNLFFAMPVGTWDGSFSAQHLGDGTWGGTLEIVSLTGKNRFSTVFTGSDDATTLFLTDDANGDAFFLDDVYTANGSDARIRKMSEIQAGAGDDIVDLTSTRFAYEEHASKQLTVRGGDGNDILWGNAGHNIMFGDAGNDKIYGGSDDDVLVGGIGNDTMHGGGGDDIFCYSNSFDWGSDTITQLAGGTVTLYLDGIDRNDCSISGSTLTWNDGTHTGSITLNGVSWDSVKFYCAANGDGDLTKQSDYEELKNKGVFAAISSH